MLIAVPSEAPGGLDARISEHFGHADLFTLVEVDGGQVGEVRVIPNQAHEQGGCMAPVTLLKEQGVDAMVAGGMGARPLSGFQSVGIDVFFKEDAQTVGEAMERFTAGECRQFGEQHTCGGGGGCGHDHDHHHHHIERKTVDGPVEKDRVVFVSFVVSDEQGEKLDEVDGIGYLHGHGNFLPGLEKAMEGKSAGDAFTVQVGPEDGYGERDESKIAQVPADHLPADIKPGDMVQGQGPDGKVMILTLKSVEGDTATLDANHPLAGRTLSFDVKVLEVQEAAPEDLQHADCDHHH